MLEGVVSPMHLLVILVVALVVLGPKRLPEAGRGLGAAMRGFRESLMAPSDESRPREREPSDRRSDERS
jgi:sec-independent protein translocase protein TatA